MGLKDTLIAAAGKAAGEIMKGFDGLFTSDEQRINAQANLTEVMNDLTKAQLVAVAASDAERTARHQTDMNSDSWLSKNVRPLSLVFLLGFFSFIVIADSISSISFEVKPAYIGLLESLLLTAFSFYFILREVGKIAVIRKGNAP
jgi:hypothetical protein